MVDSSGLHLFISDYKAHYIKSFKWSNLLKVNQTEVGVFFTVGEISRWVLQASLGKTPTVCSSHKLLSHSQINTAYTFLDKTAFAKVFQQIFGGHI